MNIPPLHNKGINGKKLRLGKTTVGAMVTVVAMVMVETMEIAGAMHGDGGPHSNNAVGNMAMEVAMVTVVAIMMVH
jgi:hypothetical protein